MAQTRQQRQGPVKTPPEPLKDFKATITKKNVHTILRQPDTPTSKVVAVLDLKFRMENENGTPSSEAGSSSYMRVERSHSWTEFIGRKHRVVERMLWAMRFMYSIFAGWCVGDLWKRWEMRFARQGVDGRGLGVLGTVRGGDGMDVRIVG